jgi:hypothetical protein
VLRNIAVVVVDGFLPFEFGTICEVFGVDRAGFGNATALRHHFRARRGTTPNAYRRLFRGHSAGTSP